MSKPVRVVVVIGVILWTSSLIAGLCFPLFSDMQKWLLGFCFLTVIATCGVVMAVATWDFLS
jgi:hypothetical protein